MDALGLLQQAKQPRLNRHRAKRGPGVDAAQIAVLAVKIQLRRKRGNFVKRLLAGRPQPRLILPMQYDLKAGSHGMARERNGFHGRRLAKRR